MRALVVGGNGLVGSRLLAELTRRGHEVRAAGRGPSRLDAGFAWASVDLGDADGLERVVRESSCEVVVNCAAMTNVDACERAPAEAWAINAQGVAALARACRDAESHLVQVSTDYVFDGDAGPYDVDAVPNPRGVYALTKHAGEQAVRALCRPGQWAVARTAVVYGWPPAGQRNFGSWLLETLSSGQPVRLFEDQWVSPSLALNVAELLADLCEARLSGLWHTAGADTVDRVTFGRRLCARFGFDEGLITPGRMADAGLAATRPAKSGLRVEKTAAALPHPPLGLEASLARFHREYEEAKTP